MVKKQYAQSMEGEDIDLDEIMKMSGWKAFQDNVQIISEKGDRILATVKVDTLITCWIEKEQEAYDETYKT